MAELTPKARKPSRDFECIFVTHATTAIAVEVDALKSDDEYSTVTRAYARSLGHQVDKDSSAVDLQWRSKRNPKYSTIKFQIVENATTKDGHDYHVVLSGSATEALLVAERGGVALVKSKNKGT